MKVTGSPGWKSLPTTLLSTVTSGAGGSKMVNPAASVPLCPSGLVTTTSRGPMGAPSRSKSQVRVVVLGTVTLLPTMSGRPLWVSLTAAPAANPVPDRVTWTVPVLTPLAGLMAVMCGGGAV